VDETILDLGHPALRTRGAPELAIISDRRIVRSRLGSASPWQWLRAHHFAVADDAIELQDIGGDRVELVIGQRYFEGCP
jgi:hypothetical protein